MQHETAFAIPLPGLVPFSRALALQEALVAARVAGRIPDVVLALEHAPVITLGMRARREHLLVSETRLREQGIAVCATSRGGDVTYHGPGQLVVYPIFQLTGADADAHRFVNRLEAAALAVCARYGIAARRRAGKTGVWTDTGKLAAIGVRFRKWVSFHGLSLNVDMDLAAFSLIVPCGLHGEPVTSLKALLGKDGPTMAEVRACFLGELGTAMHRRIRTADDAPLPDALDSILAAWRTDGQGRDLR